MGESRLISLHDRAAIEAFLRRNVALHLYELGDLDDFFWPCTTWYALSEEGQVRALALLYTATSLPVLLAVGEEDSAPLRALLDSLAHLLPRQFYAHLAPGLYRILAPAYQAESHGIHYKMALADPALLGLVDTAGVERLSPSDRPALEALYAASYPGNWFDPRMLETGYYFGLRRGGELASVAGVHVYSPRYRVAALGNITTHPQFRGQGLATRVSARLCRALLETVDTIGLNVNEDNAVAIACYEGLGFARVAEYEECMLTAR